MANHWFIRKPVSDMDNKYQAVVLVVNMLHRYWPRASVYSDVKLLKQYPSCGGLLCGVRGYQG